MLVTPPMTPGELQETAKDSSEYRSRSRMTANREVNPYLKVLPESALVMSRLERTADSPELACRTSSPGELIGPEVPGELPPQATTKEASQARAIVNTPRETRASMARSRQRDRAVQGCKPARFCLTKPPPLLRHVRPRSNIKDEAGTGT